MAKSILLLVRARRIVAFLPAALAGIGFSYQLYHGTPNTPAYIGLLLFFAFALVGWYEYRRSIWCGTEQLPKTPNAIREVDIAEPLAQLFRDEIAGKEGYIFATSTGRPLQRRNVLGWLHDTKKVGFHAFRRFRTEALRRARAPEDLIRLWLGHAKPTVTDLYADGLKNDSAWRQEWAERVGLGFSLNGLLGLQNVVPIDSAKVA